MVSQGLASITRFQKRAARARLLAERCPASSESLLFFADISDLQVLSANRDALAAFVHPRTPPAEWFDRVLAEIEEPAAPAAPKDNECPRCGAPPQLGVLRPQADGSALYLACAVCRNEWTFRRTICPACGDEGKLAFYSTVAFPALLTQTCDACKMYLHLIDAGKDPAAVPEADEIAAQPLDVWALERGYVKIVPNLVGL